VINDGRLMLGDGGKMKLDTDPFPVNVIEFEQKKVLVHTDQATATKGKNMVVSNDLRNKMIKPRSPDVGVWNAQRAPPEGSSPHLICRLIST
jgi:hypothetical protein